MKTLTLTQVAERYGGDVAAPSARDLVWPTELSGWTIEGTCDPEGGVLLTLRHRRPDGTPCPDCDRNTGVSDATALNIEAVPVVLRALHSALPLHAASCAVRGAAVLDRRVIA